MHPALKKLWQFGGTRNNGTHPTKHERIHQQTQHRESCSYEQTRVGANECMVVSFGFASHDERNHQAKHFEKSLVLQKYQRPAAATAHLTYIFVYSVLAANGSNLCRSTWCKMTKWPVLSPFESIRVPSGWISQMILVYECIIMYYFVLFVYMSAYHMSYEACMKYS